jgi:hypothetical protein
MTMNAKQMRRKPLDDEGDIARPDRLEALAMRRIVLERGYWLSPMQATTPLPRLDGKELTIDISQAHSTAPIVSRFDTGKNVLNRIDNPGQKRNTSTSLHDKYTNHAALMQHERLTSAEREVLERSKEERRKTEIEDKARRMREIEVELLPQLTEEEKARNLAKANRIKAKAAKYEAEQKRLKDLRDKAVEAKRGMSVAERHEADLKRKREQSQARRDAEKAKRLAAAPPAPVVEPKPPAKRGRPKAVPVALNLAPTKELISAEEEARATPLHIILKHALQDRLGAWKRYARTSGKPITPETEAAQMIMVEQTLMDHVNQDPDYLYKWMERRIIHARSAVIIKREKRRGNIDETTSAEARAVINPMAAKRLALEAMTPEERLQRRKEMNKVYKLNRRAAGKAN